MEISQNDIDSRLHNALVFGDYFWSLLEQAHMTQEDQLSHAIRYNSGALYFEELSQAVEMARQELQLESEEAVLIINKKAKIEQFEAVLSEGQMELQRLSSLMNEVMIATDHQNEKYFESKLKRIREITETLPEEEQERVMTRIKEMCSYDRLFMNGFLQTEGSVENVYNLCTQEVGNYREEFPALVSLVLEGQRFWLESELASREIGDKLRDLVTQLRQTQLELDKDKSDLAELQKQNALRPSIEENAQVIEATGSFAALMSEGTVGSGFEATWNQKREEHRLRIKSEQIEASQVHLQQCHYNLQRIKAESIRLANELNAYVMGIETKKNEFIAILQSALDALSKDPESAVTVQNSKDLGEFIRSLIQKPFSFPKVRNDFKVLISKRSAVQLLERSSHKEKSLLSSRNVSRHSPFPRDSKPNTSRFRSHSPMNLASKPKFAFVLDSIQREAISKARNLLLSGRRSNADQLDLFMKANPDKNFDLLKFIENREIKQVRLSLASFGFSRKSIKLDFYSNKVSILNSKGVIEYSFSNYEPKKLMLSPFSTRTLQVKTAGKENTHNVKVYSQTELHLMRETKFVEFFLEVRDRVFSFVAEDLSAFLSFTRAFV